MSNQLNINRFSPLFRLALLAVVVFGSLGAGSAALADTYVRGYHRKDGTYVQPHYRSDPDGNRFNNFSTQGNVNPYTGRVGTVDPYGAPSAPSSNYGYGGGPSQYQNPYATRNYLNNE